VKKAGFRSVAEYISAQPKATRVILRRVREAIRRAVPAAEESISYQIPAYRLEGQVMMYFAAWKEHYSLYPTTAPLVEALGDAVAGYAMSKGTIRFPLDERVPVRLIARIAKFRAGEAKARAAASASRRPRKK
jgi:uncharacterized protein YdhG (YjbR/CyaY superfamily)